jgi:hypothetical protein
MTSADTIDALTITRPSASWPSSSTTNPRCPTPPGSENSMWPSLKPPTIPHAVRLAEDTHA